MTPAELTRVETRIRVAVAQAEESGLRISNQLWFDENKVGKITHCCPLGAVIFSKRGLYDSYSTIAAGELEVSEQFVENFTSGFDGVRITKPLEKEAYALGRKLRREYIT